MKSLLLATALFAAFPVISQAEQWRHSHHERQSENHYFWEEVDSRQYNQQNSINDGINDGELTRRELKQIHKAQRSARQLINRYKGITHLSFDKKASVMDCLDDIGDKIDDLKDNDRYARREYHPTYSGHRGAGKHSKPTYNVNFSGNRFPPHPPHPLHFIEQHLPPLPFGNGRHPAEVFFNF
ncbi:MAG: hypothetical protein KAG19_01840 [Methylococcales bacterium]|nr:hypothetical protein [Methylococcales bacterium]